MKVFKYNLCLGLCQVLLPDGYRLLSVGWQGDSLKLWALVPECDNWSAVEFFVAATGQEIGVHKLGQLIGTTESDDGFVAHVFALESE